jgi:hypothetical protein
MKRERGWTKNSGVLSNHYTHAMRDRGALALATSNTGEQFLGLSDIKRMLPAAAEELASGDAHLGEPIPAVKSQSAGWKSLLVSEPPS